MSASRSDVGLASRAARRALFALVAVGLVSSIASAQSLEADISPFVEASCLTCHGDRTVTPLNLARRGFDLADHETFKAWEKVYDRLEKGEMPPAAAPKPDAAVVETALGSLKRALVDANLAARGEQRTPLRRLTRLEYRYTIQDLLLLDEAVTEDVGQMLPAEVDSGGFDTVAVHQSMSPLHVRSYLEAADRALDLALVLGPRPSPVRHRVDYATHPTVRRYSNSQYPARRNIKMLDDAAVIFFDLDYLLPSDRLGFRVRYPGRYRATVEAYAYQANTPVTLTLLRAERPGRDVQPTDLVGVFDLVGTAPQTGEATTYLRPGELLSTSVLTQPLNPSVIGPDRGANCRWGNVKNCESAGVALKSMTIEGPLIDGVWPPASTRQLLTGVEFDQDGEIRLTKDPYEHVVDIVAAFAPRAFRRPLTDAEVDAYAGLAKPLLDEGRPFLDVVRVPLRAILSASPFHYHAGEAGTDGMLNDFGLATRLSYFLWRSTPDGELFDLAREGRLSDPGVLAEQVDRMLDDAKHERFVKDLAGQAFRLYELSATGPDPALYPEFDEWLAQSMARETELFLAELIAEDHGAGRLIDSDFTFLNRRLADHYDIAGIDGQQMRKVTLPADSPRGGLLTQASVLKVTANGTTTSPVPRGNFVLANLLGQPAPPPPVGVSAIEPDTRGTTTIREQLDAHRSSPVCASCHRVIDPPGFALESFDPIGGFRTTYRVSGGEIEVNGRMRRAPYTEGLPVDPSGVTPKGDRFARIEEYKQLLLQRDVDQVARHVASQLFVFSTGAEIEFADRDAVEQIIEQGRNAGHPVRNMIHEVVQSDLFRSR